MAISCELLSCLQSGLVASCQPVSGGPMDQTAIIVAMDQAAVAGGAVAVRIEGIENVRAVKSAISVPVVGLVKRDLADSAVRITALLSDVTDLAEAGADIVAYDATLRERPVSAVQLLEQIHQCGKVAMADCSNEEDGMAAWQQGAELIGTTLAGYTEDLPVPLAPDLNLVKRLSQAGCYVVAEGRYNSPELAAAAIAHGAFCVTVGSALTRVEHICQWFCEQIKAKALMQEQGSGQVVTP
ncbi:Putative N-acetylmannosamine-6-phosphate 2-epimerase [Piscirickettsia salmonis]|uniref:N-acetylmannosamine-6-phosphate 2-epimerase n=1 Tax=Piscirickettsia salmonis TaxID=1238 RepID=UPI0012B7D1E7|nr:putative N-acetylmannosamine-6-phosphate 2-epimerase [Piscirickettsia salmonis]QGP48962.1 Putative N-acetylmannosamine-6-phosphate 2-epimerase [Piscirickettsia salmonis]